MLGSLRNRLETKKSKQGVYLGVLLGSVPAAGRGRKWDGVEAEGGLQSLST